MKRKPSKSAISFMLVISFIFLVLSGCSASEFDGDIAGGGEENGAMAPMDGGHEKADDAPDGDATNQGGDDNSQDSSYKFEENPFISTDVNNVSTFSADVDTASYTYFRNLIGKGYRLDDLIGGGASFRTEEFINYFRYDVSQPQENELFGVYTEVAPCPWNEENMLFRVTLQAEKPENDVPNNLVFLIDVSGSMGSSDKLPLLKKAFSYLVSELDASDTVSIVTYSGREEVVLDGCSGMKADIIMSSINGLNASGSTNGEAGLTMAYQIAEKHFVQNGNNRIIMASDGDLNVGITSESQLKSYIEEKRRSGVYLSVLGFGTGNYRDASMETLADNGNGAYYYIDGESEAEKVFGTDLLGTLYTVADDVKLQVVFDSESVSSYRLVGYENRILDKEDFDDDRKDAGEVGAGHQVTVCYEIELTEMAEPRTLMTLKVRYKKPGESLSLLNEYGIGSDTIRDEMSDDTKFICAVIETAMVLHESPYLNGIDIDRISEKLDSLTLSDPYKLEFRELIRGLVRTK